MLRVTCVHVSSLLELSRLWLWLLQRFHNVSDCLCLCVLLPCSDGGLWGTLLHTLAILSLTATAMLTGLFLPRSNTLIRSIRLAITINLRNEGRCTRSFAFFALAGVYFDGSVLFWSLYKSRVRNERARNDITWCVRCVWVCVDGGGMPWSRHGRRPLPAFGA